MVQYLRKQKKFTQNFFKAQLSIEISKLLTLLLDQCDKPIKIIITLIPLRKFIL